MLSYEIFFSVSPDFDILFRSCWHHVFRQLMFCFRSPFLADKAANNKLLCQDTPCSLPAVDVKSSPHLPNSLSSDLSISLCTKQKIPFVWCTGLFFTNNEHRFTICAIVLEEIWFRYGFLIRLPLYILPLHTPILQSSLFPLNWSEFLGTQSPRAIEENLLSLDQTLSVSSGADTHLASGWGLETHKRGVGSLALDICQ